MAQFARRGVEPPDFFVVRPTLEALDREMAARMSEKSHGKSRQESTWPVVQLNWQRTRYVHDLFYKFGRISEACFEYCRRNKLIDGALSDKWLEPGYEKLCSLYVIDPKNHAFGTTSLCRVPPSSRPQGVVVCDPFSGCRGCSSGEGGESNIFGNKYGQRLAGIQIAREEEEAAAAAAAAKAAVEEEEEKKKRKADKAERKKSKRRRKDRDGDDGGDGDGAGAGAAEGVWAVSQAEEAAAVALVEASEAEAAGDGDGEGEGEGEAEAHA